MSTKEDISGGEEDEQDESSSQPCDDGLSFDQQVAVPASEVAVTSISVVNKGNRMVTGDLHGELRQWDFNNMDLTGSRYREHRLPENHSVESVAWSHNGAHILVASNERFVRVFDSSLEPMITTFKGDMYVRDAAKTMGHTHTVNDLQWHPNDEKIFGSGSLDGTVRIWDVESRPQGLDRALASLLVLKTIDKRNATISRECGVNSVTFGGPQEVTGGCDDDSLQIWDCRTGGIKSKKPRSVLRGHHEGEGVRKVLAGPDNELYSRSTNWLCAFDNRQSKSPVHKLQLLHSDLKRTCLAALQFGKYLFTSTRKQIDQSDADHYVSIIDTKTFEQIDALLVPSAVNAVHACESLSQLFCSLSNGQVICFFTAKTGLPLEGAAAIKQGPKAPQSLSNQSQQTNVGLDADSSYSWYNLPANIRCLNDGTLKEIKPRRHQLRSEANPAVPLSMHLPHEEPILKRTMAQSVMKSFLDAEAAQRGSDEDWVEQLRHGKSAGALKYGNVSIVNQAYQITQPEPVLDTSPLVEGGEALLTGERKCPQCGLKMCTCGYLTLLRGRLEGQKLVKKPRIASNND